MLDELPFANPVLEEDCERSVEASSQSLTTDANQTASALREARRLLPSPTSNARPHLLCDAARRPRVARGAIVKKCELFGSTIRRHNM